MENETDIHVLQNKLRDIEHALNESSMVSITDTRGNIQFANKMFCEVSQYSLEELMGNNQRFVNSGYHSKAFFKKLWQTIGSGNVWHGEIRNKAKDGSFYWVYTTIVPFLKDNGKPYQYISIRHEVTKRKEYEEKMKQMAYYDPLTSLPNRNYLVKWMNERPCQHGSFAVLFLDLDRFKLINDNYGHHTGDRLLMEIADRLNHTLHETDFISRQGGDEFIIILDNVADKQEVKRTVNWLLKKIKLPILIENESMSVTASIGISMNNTEETPENSENIERRVLEADTAMYHAKRSGGDGYCFNTPTQNEDMERYYELAEEIKYALDDEQFTLKYQPIVNLKNDHIFGVEALLRWNNPKLGNVSPGEFIPIMEEIGYIVPIGKWVLRTACKQMQAWLAAGIHLHKLAVNVSPIEFRSSSFIKDLKEILEETGLDAHLLEFEITEGTLFNIDQSFHILKDLKALGVDVSIDDFGTGYSSLSYLKQLPIDTLKIDKSFIDNLDSDGQIIIDTIINMGSNLDFTVIAEGIEHSEQLHYLKSKNCHAGQGYYFSKPLTEKEFFDAYVKQA